MLRWLTRLFRHRAEVENAEQPPIEAAAVALGAPSAAIVELPVVQAAPDQLAEAAPSQIRVAVAGFPETGETCPNCGRTGAFAGPPDHRYCMHCTLRQELFGASAATEK